jgi:hypothetical protein
MGEFLKDHGISLQRITAHSNPCGLEGTIEKLETNEKERNH